jgi:hypothetical protein
VASVSSRPVNAGDGLDEAAAAARLRSSIATRSFGECVDHD